MRRSWLLEYDDCAAAAAAEEKVEVTSCAHGWPAEESVFVWRGCIGVGSQPYDIIWTSPSSKQRWSKPFDGANYENVGCCHTGHLQAGVLPGAASLTSQGTIGGLRIPASQRATGARSPSDVDAQKNNREFRIWIDLIFCTFNFFAHDIWIGWPVVYVVTCVSECCLRVSEIVLRTALQSVGCFKCAEMSQKYFLKIVLIRKFVHNLSY